MVYKAYSCKNINNKKIINVAGGGLTNGNAYAYIEILYKDHDMEEVERVLYKEYGKNPIFKIIGDNVEWCEDDYFKILNNNEYVDSEDEYEDEDEDEDEE